MKNQDIMKDLLILNNNTETETNNNIRYSKCEKYSGFINKLTEIIENENIRGTVIAATDDEIIWASGSRSVNRDGAIVTPADTFEIGSVTKTFTACCVMKLAEEGRIDLCDKVISFFPDYTKAGDMTVYDLLHMRSGIADFANEFEAFFDIKNKPADFEQLFWSGKLSDEAFLDDLYKLDLKFTPSSKTEYSNTNYVLLAMIIEKVSGRSYKECIEDMVFSPAGMECSSADTIGDVTSCPEEADGYHLAQHSARGAGDIHSNVLDMLRFDRAYFARKIINSNSIETMLKFDDGYGCGWTTDGYCWWHKEGTPYDKDLVFHSGETLSYVCDNIVFNASGERIYLIMMSPCFTDETSKIVELCKTELMKTV